MTRLTYVLLVLVLGLIPIDSSAFKANLNTKRPFFKKFKKKKIAPEDIRNIFLFFPDEVYNVNEQTELSLATRQQILETLDLVTARKEHFGFVLEKLDLENGYLKFRTVGEWSGQEVEMRQWKTKNKHQLVAVNVRHSSSCCSHSEIRFYDYYDYEYKEVTAEIFPEIPLAAFSREALPAISGGYLQNFVPTYELPQFGNEIRVVIDDSPLFDGMPNELQTQLNQMLDMPVLKMVWKGDRFRVR